MPVSVPVVRFTRVDGSERVIEYGSMGRAQRDAALTASIWPDVRAEWMMRDTWLDRLWKNLRRRA